jgi:ATP-dependent exoDNAse (exonuclease V) alpha subunit
VDVDEAWLAVGEEFGLTREGAQSLYSHGLTTAARDPGHALLADVTREHSTVSDRDLHARAYELAAGVHHPREADSVVAELIGSGSLVELEGGRWTTRELRERERDTLDLARSRTLEHAAPVGGAAVRKARLDVQQDLGAPLSREQRDAVATITGEGGVSVLVGQAGTGKGVVLRAATGAWQREGYEVIGTAVAGATAERLGEEAKLDKSLTTDALLARVESGGVQLDSKTVVIMDEAAMADTRRLAALNGVTARAEAKLVLVGDQAQLSAIGAGGMFAALHKQVPTAELLEVYRAKHAWEREAWQQVRAGDAERALAGYDARERLHISDTREEAVERMVDDWDRTRREHPDERIVMLSDASNAELERVNALAQDRRARAGELGAHVVELPDRPYGLAAGDEVIFTAALRRPGRPRVENGTLGTVVETAGADRVSIQTTGREGREVHVGAEELEGLRLAYAQHVYKAQGRTVDWAFVLTGGWQTDRERAYVALSRAQQRTDIYVSREDLGEEGMDAGAIERLGESMAVSHAERASIATPEPIDPPWRDSGSAEIGRESEAARAMRDAQARHDRDHGLGWGLD